MLHYTHLILVHVIGLSLNYIINYVKYIIIHNRYLELISNR